MQVHQTPQNKGPKLTASMVQRIALLEKKVEQLQANTVYSLPVTLAGGVESPNSTLVGTAPLVGVDTTGYGTSSSTLTQVTNAWTIPAGDSIVNTAYRLTAYGQGSIGAAASLLQFFIASFGTTGAGTGINSGVATGQSFAWMVTGTLVIVSSTTAHFETNGVCLIGNANGGRASTTNNVSFCSNSLSTAISAGSATTMMLQAQFGVPGAGTTMNCNLSTFERL